MRVLITKKAPKPAAKAGPYSADAGIAREKVVALAGLPALASLAGEGAGTAAVKASIAKSSNEDAFRGNPLLRDFLMATGYLTSHEDRQVIRVIRGVSSQCDVMCAPAVAIMNTPVFDFFFSFVIVCNAVTMGMEADGLMSDEVIMILEHLFTALFSVELFVRLGAQRNTYLDDPWNWFDLICVSSSWLDVYFLPLIMGGGSGTNVSVARLFRIFRLGKATRILRVLRVFSELRVLIQVMVDSLRSLFWTLLLLLVFLYVFAVLMVNLMVDYQDVPLGDAYTSGDLFGSVGSTMLTLFQIMTLDEWASFIARPLLDAGLGSMVALLIFFLCFTTFAVLNIVTGVFVDSTATATMRDEEAMAKASIAEQNSLVKRLKYFFEAIDTDDSGTLTYDEFEAVVSNSKELRENLAYLSLGPREVRGLFRMLDVDGGGEVSIDEFIFGCLNMKMARRSLDVVTIQYEYQKLRRDLHSLIRAHRQMSQYLLARMDAMCAAVTRALSVKRAQIAEVMSAA
mmetsp:Transcript_29128/g.62160  ORF Transcript_29128/g.62160 Transcript_29128/m.62160 type:complete len:512 (+) Transcript_29128:1-1536(+)